MSLFSFLTAGSKPAGKGGNQDRVDPGWVRNPRGSYFYLLDADTYEDKANGVGGVFVVWHGGMKPSWLFVGHSKDVGASLNSLRIDRDIRTFEANGRLFCTWAPIKDFGRPGVVSYLIEVLNPKKGGAKPKAEPIPVYIPG